MARYQQPLPVQEPRTPIKRSYSSMNEAGLPTPQTENRVQQLNGNSDVASGKRRATNAEFLNLVSPATTPSPLRFRDAGGAGTADDPLFSDITQALASYGVELKPETANAVQNVCDRSTLRTQGVIKGWVL
jgi:hypothetical protein